MYFFFYIFFFNLYSEEFESTPSLSQVSTHLHETLDTIENLIESGMFNGCVRTVFDIIERCSTLRPVCISFHLFIFVCFFKLKFN